MTIAVPNLRAVICAPGWARSELWRRARAVPRLDLRFAENKSLVDQISGSNLITFTRSGDATYVDSDGLIKTAGTNVPRFDHNPTTGECLGLLVEEQRTNLLLRSEEFDNASWGLVAGTVSANQTPAPNGTTTADNLIAANGGSQGQVFQSVAIASGATVTGSVYAKGSGLDGLELVLLSNNNTTPYGRSAFNPNTGTITTAAFVQNGGTNASSNVQVLGNGWYRFSVTVTYPAAAAAGMRLAVFNSDASNGDGVKGVFLWGAQLETGAFPTSYIPTTSSAVTRNADVVSITGTNFSSWYRQDEGTFYGDTFRQFAVPASDFPLIVDSRVGTDRLQIGYLTEVLASAYVQVGGVAQAEMYPSSGNARNRKVVFAAAPNNYATTCNGGLILTDTSGTMPTSMVSLGIGSHTQNSQYLNGTIRRLTYWPARLPNATLQAITQ